MTDQPSQSDLRLIDRFLRRYRPIPTPDQAYAAGRRVLAAIDVEAPPTLTAAFLGETLRERGLLP